MRRINTLIATLVGCALSLTLSLSAQQTQLTQGQIKSAEAEVPELAKHLALTPGMSIADVGAGFGAWTIQFAKLVGPGGRVYATDIGTAQLAALRDAVKREGLSNVTVIEGGMATTNLPANCCDAILMRDAYHHLTAPAEIVKSLAASLKSGGRLAIVDFPPRPSSQIPEGVPANRGGHGVPPDVVEKEASAALTHVQTLTKWAPGSEPASLFLVLMQKAP